MLRSRMQHAELRVTGAEGAVKLTSVLRACQQEYTAVSKTRMIGMPMARPEAVALFSAPMGGCGWSGGVSERSGACAERVRSGAEQRVSE